jgi:predicted alpha-1,2-mannosidase
MKIFFFLLVPVVVMISCKQEEKAAADRYVNYVDPFIGTASHGHVFLGANLPFGAVQLGPVNLTEGWDWCSGYNYIDSSIIGFAHTHLSGTGIGDLGDIMVMPVTGRVDSIYTYGHGRPRTGYFSLFSHEDEIAQPGYYSVKLKRYNVLAELTTTARVGFHQYQFPKSDTAGLMFDLESGIGWDAPVETSIALVNDTTITGSRRSKGWALNQLIYFTAIISKPVVRVQLYDSTSAVEGTAATGRKLRALLKFATAANEKVKLKVGISPVSIENAALNIQAELPGWDFALAKNNATSQWEHELSKVKIRTADETRKKIFYTALYHTMIAPSIFNDHNGDYRGTDGKVYRNAGFTNLSIFSLWDTYRGANPLYTVIQPERVNDIVNSLLAIYQQQGRLPVWHLAGNETNTMPGNSSVQVVADAYLKGFRGFDTALAWQAVKATAMQDARGMSFVKKLGYIPADSLVESVAMGLEYAIADWSIAQMAKRMGLNEDHAYFSKRARYYENYFDTTIRFVRGRVSADQWRTPFSPLEARHMRDDFSEGNSWQYTWMIPHDVEGLIRLMGGKDAFNKKLDSLFELKADMGKEASADITGLVGQYAHGNEPSHHIAYLYTYTGQPWKTADKVRYMLDSMYADRHDGLCGNEDAGQMSAWYVLSALGFYQVNPANGKFVFGSPVMDEATISVGKNRTLHIVVKNNSRENKYIQSVRWNGQAYERSYLLYKDMMAGGELVIEMGGKPSTTWGVSPSSWPVSSVD